MDVKCRTSDVCLHLHQRSGSWKARLTVVAPQGVVRFDKHIILFTPRCLLSSCLIMFLSGFDTTPAIHIEPTPELISREQQSLPVSYSSFHLTVGETTELGDKNDSLQEWPISARFMSAATCSQQIAAGAKTRPRTGGVSVVPIVCAKSRQPGTSHGSVASPNSMTRATLHYILHNIKHMGARPSHTIERRSSDQRNRQ